MNVKKLEIGFFFLLSVVLLVGCGNKVTQDDLINNKWAVVFEETKDEELLLVADFTKEKMILSLDSSNVKTEATNEFEEIGEDIAKNILSNFSYKVDYKLNGKTIHLKSKELDLDDDFDVKKKKDSIIFANQKSKVEMILTPYKESSKKEENNSTKESDSSNDTSTSLSVESEKTITAENPNKFNGNISISNDSFELSELKFDITNISVINPGDTGNEFGEKPVLAIWYSTTNKSDAEHTPLDWIHSVTAIQDNDPNKINQLNVASLPDEAFIDNQSAIIKKNGTVENAIAYELTDTETEVTLKINDYKTDKNLKAITIKLK